MEIKKDTFKSIKDTNAKLDMLYDIAKDTQIRVQALEKKRVFHALYATGAGALAGAATVFAKIFSSK